MKNFNKYCVLAASLLFMGACAEANVEEAVISSGSDFVLTIPVSTADATDSRVSVDGDWNLTWDEYDGITACNLETNNNAFCIVSEINGTEAVFTSYGYTNGSQIAPGDYIRIFTPDSSSDSSEGGYVTFDVSSQTAGLTSTVLISDIYYEVAESGVLPVVPMKHVGAAVVLNMAFANLDYDYTLLSVDVAGLSSSATVDLSSDYNVSSGTQTSTGVISVDFVESLSMVMSSADIKFNIMPSTIGVGESVTVTYNLVDLNNTKYTVTDVVANDGAAAVVFARGTYNNLYSTCDLNNLEEVQVPYTVAVTPSAKNATLSFEVNFELCDAVALAYEPNYSPSFWESDLVLFEADVVRAEENYRVITDSDPVSAYAWGDWLESNTSYGIFAVAYKVVDGVNTVVYSETIQFTTTSASAGGDGDSTGGDVVTGDVVIDSIEVLTAQASNVIFKVYSSSAAGFNYGFVSVADAEQAGGVQAWIDSSGWWNSQNPWAKYLNEGALEVSDMWLDFPTDYIGEDIYYLFVIPFDSSSVNGTMSYVEVDTVNGVTADSDSTGDTTLDIPYDVDLSSTDALVTFELTDCSIIHAWGYNNKDITGTTISDFETDAKGGMYFASVMTAGYAEYNLANNCDVTVGESYTIFFMGKSASGSYSDVRTIEVTIPEAAASGDITYSVSSLEVNVGASSLMWYYNPSNPAYGYSFITNMCQPSLAVDITGDADEYVYYTISKESVNSEQQAIDDAISFSAPESVYGTQITSLYLTDDLYLVVVPLDAEGNKNATGAMVLSDIDWDILFMYADYTYMYEGDDDGGDYGVML